MAGIGRVAAQHYSGHASFIGSVATTVVTATVVAVVGDLPTGGVAEDIICHRSAAARIGLEVKGAQARRHRADSNFQGDVRRRCARCVASIVRIEGYRNTGTTAGASQYGAVDEHTSKENDEHNGICRS